MKKRTAFVSALLLTGILAFAGTGSTTSATRTLNPQPLPPGMRVALNPQPLPPGSAVALNPQPFPPGPTTRARNGSEKVALNPQPLPPGAKALNSTPAANNRVNPQPLPPGSYPTATSSDKSSLK